jgi:hypothetical protein
MLILRRAKPKSPVILPPRARAPPQNPTRNRGFSVKPFFKNRHWVESSHGWHYKLKNIVNERPWPSFDLLFFWTASLRLIHFYRIVWLVLLDLVVSRFSFLVYCRFSCCLVSLTMAPVSSPSPPPDHVALVPRCTRFFCQPLHQQTWWSFWPVFTTAIISDGGASVVQYSFHIKVQDIFLERWRPWLFWPTYGHLTHHFCSFFPCCPSLFQLSRREQQSITAEGWHAQQNSNNNQYTNIKSYTINDWQ